MEQYIEKYKVENIFLNRYFIPNAVVNLSNQLLELQLWRKGKFIHPKKINEHKQKLILDEIINFYEKGTISIPQVGFAITTRCNLKCKHCNNLIPLFNNENHKTVSFNDFVGDIDELTGGGVGIGRLIFLGGEPLLNSDLAKMVEYSAENKQIKMICITTNGTLLPSCDLVKAVSQYSDKVFFRISNYSRNKELADKLRHDAIFAVLKENNIKYILEPNEMWRKEEPLEDRNYTEAQVKDIFRYCQLNMCHSVLNGKFHICPKSSAGYELGIIKTADSDFINLRSRSSKNIKEELVNFYKKDCYEVCKFCVRPQEEIIPAEQIK
ncbi:hypothetical protein FACS189468_7780 [Spirochaetia bacterium]|nr:hypothetical protein FACS189468_7780 [Spirochaetia bacterium]